MKKTIPTNILLNVEPLLDTNKEIIKVNDPEAGYYYDIQDKDSSSPFYFNVAQSDQQTRASTHCFIEYMPIAHNELESSRIKIQNSQLKTYLVN